MKKNILILSMFILLLTSCIGEGQRVGFMQMEFPNCQIYKMPGSNVNFIVINPLGEVRHIVLQSDAHKVINNISVGKCGKVADKEETSLELN